MVGADLPFSTSLIVILCRNARDGHSHSRDALNLAEATNRRILPSAASQSSLVERLEDRRDALPATDAERGRAVAQPVAPQLVNQGDR